MDDRIIRLEAELRRVKRYAAVLTVAIAALVLAAFQQTGRARFTELDVERLNVIEKDGRLRLAIANSERLPPIVIRGKEYPGLRGGNAPGGAGMIYFNDEGTENGGYIWSGRTMSDGSYHAAGFLTFDQYDQDEALTLGYTDANGARRAGLTVIDEPNVPIQQLIDTLMAIRTLRDTAEQARRMKAFSEEQTRKGLVRANRVFVGKDPTRSALVWLADPKGRPRLRLSVDSLGAPLMEFLDDKGAVTDRFPSRAR